MSILRQNYTTGQDSNSTIQGIAWFAQTFTPSVSHIIDQVALYIYKSGTPPAALVISIQGVDDNGRPDGSEIAAGTIAASAVADSYSWVTCVLNSTASLATNTTYSIVVSCPAADGTHNYKWGVDTTSPTYTNGKACYSINSGTTWYDSAGPSDFLFKEYGEYNVAAGIPTDKIYSKKLIAVAANQLWYEDSSGSMIELSAANNDIDVNNSLQIFEAFQKVFIVNEANFKVADFANIKLHTTDITPEDKVYPRHGTLITASGGTASGAQMVVDYITVLDGDCYVYGQRITDAEFASGDICTASITEGSVSFTLDAAEVAGPHWYDWTIYGNDSSYGTMPNKARLSCLYRGRAVLSGNPQYPNQWYMARIGNPWDFNYDSLDALSAVAGNNADAGEIGDIINALIPYKDDFIIFGCANTMWVMVGDPASGGSIDELDLTVGIFGPKSWCFDSSGNLYFWGTGGVYVCPYSGGRPSKPKLLTGLNLPKIIKDEAVDVTTHRIILAYDPYRDGILIFITKLSDGSNSNYWYDLKTEGFFPESYPNECGVYSAFYYTSTDNTKTDLILGGFDGYMRKFDDSAKDDDSGDSDTTINSYFTLIHPLGDGEDIKGKLTSLTVTTAGGASGGDFGDSDGVSYEYHSGDDAETVLEDMIDGATARESGTLSTTGRQSRIRKRIKGHFLGLKFYNSTASETFAIEKITGEIKAAGKN